MLPGAGLAADAAVMAQLVKAKNCVACHLMDSRVLGPSFKEIAARYRGNAEAPALLTSHIQHGSKDVWGPVPMPSNNQVTEEEARALASWVLTR